MPKREPKKLQVLGKFGGGIDMTGAKVGQIIEVADVDEAGKPTAWKAVDKPAKLSDLKNDLFYANVTKALTLTKADFVPKYVLDEDGNPTDEIDFYYYRGAPALDWFTSPDKIGFLVTFTEDEERFTSGHRVPDISANYDDAQWTDRGYVDEDAALYPWVFCDECSTGIFQGFNPFIEEELVPEDAFYVQTYWGNGSDVGFDSITIYKVDSKLISKDEYDHSEIDATIANLGYGLEEAFNVAISADNTAYQADTAASNAQTTADQAKTAASNAQTTADQAKTAVKSKASVRSVEIALKITEALDISVGESYSVTQSGFMISGTFTPGDVILLKLSAVISGAPVVRTASMCAVDGYTLTGTFMWFDAGFGTFDIAGSKVFAVVLKNIASTSDLTLIRLR